MTEVVKKLPVVSRRIPGLDGLRAVAVTAVLLYHLMPTWVPGGYIGVDIFFVISGFLITSLLLREYREHDSVALLAFWRRRARRLLPALLVMIGVVSSAALFIGGDVLVSIGRQLFGTLTFSTNWIEIIAGANYFASQNPQLFTNVWSLAVEEQFYLLWPFLVIAMISAPWLLRQRYLGLLVSVLFAVGSATAMALLYDGQNATRVYYGLDTHLFGLMIGAAMAFWEYARTFTVPVRRLSSHVPFTLHWYGMKLFLQLCGLASGIGLFILMAVMNEQAAWAYSGGLFGVALLSAVVIMAAMNRNGLLRRLLSIRWIEWVGVRSYGIYLWHWPLFVLFGLLIPRSPSSTWIVGLATVVVTIGVAALSYRYIEQPVLRYGIRGVLQRAIVRKPVIITNAHTRWVARPHPMLFGGLAIAALTCTAVIIAPHQTQAEAQVAAGKVAIKKAQDTGSVQAKPVEATPVAHETAPPPPVPVQPRVPITGTDITLIGDSVALASAPALLAQFPGMIVDAQISRSLRVGGFDDIAAHEASGNLRHVVVIALGTNGYYGTGNLDKLIATLGEREVIFVTSYAPREWIDSNNANIEEIATKHSNVRIAHWDQAISSRPDGLGPDGIHPNSIGGEIYAACLQAVVDEMNN